MSKIGLSFVLCIFSPFVYLCKIIITDLFVSEITYVGCDEEHNKTMLKQANRDRQR